MGGIVNGSEPKKKKKVKRKITEEAPAETLPVKRSKQQAEKPNKVAQESLASNSTASHNVSTPSAQVAKVAPPKVNVIVRPDAAADDDGMFVPFELSSSTPVPKERKERLPKASAADEKREKWIKKLQEEKEVDRVEQAREENPAPQTAEGFKMLLASNPNSSYAWCQFIAFWLFRGEVSKARQVCELALQTINCREEQEIYNVWVAYLALEDKHGTLESLHAIFRRAIQNVDQEKKLWYFMIDLMYKGEKYGRVHHMYKEMLRRFNADVDVWAAFYRWCVRLRKEEELKQIPKDALNSLTKDQHINMMTRFGSIDMKEGNVDRGRTIFEGLLSKFPRRGDVWSVYVDMEKAVMKRGKGSPKQLRALFDRVTTLNLSSKTMQSFFTRYMEFEKEFGTEASQKAVHDKAVRYVEQKCAVV